MADDSMLSTPTSSNAHDDTFDTDEPSLLDQTSHIQPSTTNAANNNTTTNTTAASSSRTTTHTANTSAHLNALHPGEVSPPRSQDNTPATRSRTLNGLHGRDRDRDHDGLVSLSDEDGDEDEGIAMGDDEYLASSGIATPAGGGGEEGGNVAGGQDRLRRRRAGERDDGPGAGWRNKKAQEEMARAWEFVVDRDWSVRQYGDPLGHKVR